MEKQRKKHFNRMKCKDFRFCYRFVVPFSVTYHVTLGLIPCEDCVAMCFIKYVVRTETLVCTQTSISTSQMR